MAENLRVFFQGLDHGTAVFVTPKGKKEVKVYFDNAFINADLGEAVLDTTAPRLTCVSADLSFLPRDPKAYRGWDVFVTSPMMPKTRFSLVQIQPEGTGISTIILAHEE